MPLVPPEKPSLTQWLHQLTFAPIEEGSLLSTPSLAFVIGRPLMVAALNGVR